MIVEKARKQQIDPPFCSHFVHTAPHQHYERGTISKLELDRLARCGDALASSSTSPSRAGASRLTAPCMPAWPAIATPALVSPLGATVCRSGCICYTHTLTAG